MKYQIYLKGGAMIPADAERIEFPQKSETLQIYISATETDKDKIILTSEVAAILRENSLGVLAYGAASPSED